MQSLSTVISGQAKEVMVFKYETGEFVGKYYAIAEACRILGCFKSNSHASNVAKGIRNQTHGYVFKYV